ncbi:MAG: hypothetical protein LEGION0398_MBIBDBAK_00002 [Legionellaceae bacterium]
MISSENWKKNFFYPILFGLIIFILFNILISLFSHKPDRNVKDPSFTIPGTVNLPDQVLAIDMKMGKQAIITERDIANGNAPFLVFIQANEQGNYREPRFLKSFSELVSLDTTGNGQLNLADKDYKKIYLAYITPEGIIKYISLENAGIYALLISQEHLTIDIKTKAGILINNADVALLNDNSQRAIIPVLIGQQVLLKLVHTLENKNN